MMRGWGPGPVFAFECLTAARRRRMYVARALFVSLLMIGLGTIWVSSGRTFNDRSEAGADRERVLLRGDRDPARGGGDGRTGDHRRGRSASTRAGGPCNTPSSPTSPPARSSCGKLASRLASVLSLLACGLPVLGPRRPAGRDRTPGGPRGRISSRSASPSLGSALALTFSVWARWPHQALLPTYAVLGVWAGAWPAAIVFFGIGPPATWRAGGLDRRLFQPDLLPRSRRNWIHAATCWARSSPSWA